MSQNEKRNLHTRVHCGSHDTTHRIRCQLSWAAGIQLHGDSPYRHVYEPADDIHFETANGRVKIYSDE